MGITSDCGRIIGIPSMHENQGIEYWGEFKPRRATVCIHVVTYTTVVTCVTVVTCITVVTCECYSVTVQV